MTTELYWLTLTTLMTALFWLPYVLNRIMSRGLMGTLGNAGPDSAPQAAWAERAIAAHRNGVENLVIFAALVLVANIAGVASTLTAAAAAAYFFARLAHFVIQTAGIPVLRTLAFAAGWVCQMIFALSILGML